MGAVGVTGIAAAAAVPDQEMAEEGPVFTGDELLEIALDFSGIGFGREAEAERETRHVCVDYDAFV